MDNTILETRAAIIAGCIDTIAQEFKDCWPEIIPSSLILAALEGRELLIQEEWATLDDTLIRARKLRDGGYRNWSELESRATFDL